MKTINLASTKPARYKVETLPTKRPTPKGQHRLFGVELDIAPKPTKYQGHNFRSRLEARWAVLFDSLEIKWRYEPCSFDLGFATINGKQTYLGGYIPDLYLPDYEVWIEIKPMVPHQDSVEWAKVRRLVKHICKGSSGFILAALSQTAFVYGNAKSISPIINHISFDDAVRIARNYQFTDKLK